ncbi:MAG: type IV secretion system protein VirB10 [Sulfurimonas sp.]|uniref:type IV secretion system protein VirB10 n=1 Tax=Sulfurimonas sp. TaxID=2022749 RepID=UPI003569282F
MQNDNIENEQQNDLVADKENVKRTQTYIMFAAAALIVLLLLITAISKLTKTDDNEDTKSVESSSSKPKVEKKEFSFKPALVEQNITAAPFGQNEESILTPKILKGASSIMSEEQTSSTTSTNEADAATHNNSDSSLAGESEYIGDTFVAAAAKVSQFDPNYLLPKGSYIECSLDTRLVSQIKGGIACTVSNDIYSSNGNVLLIDKGSKITGMFKADQMNDGVNRLFVIWQEIRTPNNVVIPVFSGASDPLGGSGIEGDVDHKWMMRFGSAIMLSAIDDAFNVLATKINSNINTINNIDYTENTRSNGSNMAEIALENFIKLKPTLYKNQGDLVGVYVNRDIDFSQAYELQRR